MSERLLTEAELAEALRLAGEHQVKDLRRKHRWPHVRLGRYDVRYTESQVAQIIAEHTVAQARPTSKPLPGQTPRSARRSA